MKHHQKARRGAQQANRMKWSGRSFSPSVSGETDWNRPHLPADLLRPSLLELYLVDGPHRPFHVFYSHKTLVKTKIMPDGILQLVTKTERVSIRRETFCHDCKEETV